MIITITGKPCSGKGTAGKLFCEKYNFEYMSTGDMIRGLAKKYGFENILEFQKSKYINDVDQLIDSNSIEIGKTRANDNLLIDSRLAWHFIPNSFKIFIDVDWDTAAERLLNANRNTEQASTIEQAKKDLINRWETENNRYSKLYKTNNLNQNNYNLVISSNNKTPEEIVEEIYNAYQKFIEKA